MPDWLKSLLVEALKDILTVEMSKHGLIAPPPSPPKP